MTLSEFYDGYQLWVVLSVAAVLALGVVVYFWLRKPIPFESVLQRRSRILSPAEKNFFECLLGALNDEFFIFTKVAMLDVVQILPSIGYFGKKRIRKQLAVERFDYVLCKRHDLSIFGVVELQNLERRGAKSKRSVRNHIVNSVCKATRVRLFFFDVRQNYRDVDIRRLVTGRVSQGSAIDTHSVQQSQMTIDNSSYAAFARQRNCPQCNGEMVTKVAIKGKHLGQKFLMCRKYPYCDYRVAIDDKRVKQDVAKQSVEQEGYSNWSTG